MIQEIITYIIIGSALLYAAFTIWKKTRKKKRKSHQENRADAAPVMHNTHNCDDCPADCMFRDASSKVTGRNESMCTKIETNSE